MKKRFLQIKYWILSLLKSGVTPREIGIAVACGVVIGVFPVLGSTTLICFAIAWIFKLNHILIQTVNYLVYPLQWLLYLPFISMGRWIAGEEGLKVGLEEIKYFWQFERIKFFKEIMFWQMYGILAWLILALPLFLAVFFWLKRRSEAMRLREYSEEKLRSTP